MDPCRDTKSNARHAQLVTPSETPVQKRALLLPRICTRPGLAALCSLGFSPMGQCRDTKMPRICIPPWSGGSTANAQTLRRLFSKHSQPLLKSGHGTRVGAHTWCSGFVSRPGPAARSREVKLTLTFGRCISSRSPAQAARQKDDLSRARAQGCERLLTAIGSYVLERWQTPAVWSWKCGAAEESEITSPFKIFER